MPTPDDVEAALRRVVAVLADAAERPGQITMARAVAHAIDAEEHLVVQAGTGTGNTLAYLVPAALMGTRSIVVTATKALQERVECCPPYERGDAPSHTRVATYIHDEWELSSLCQHKG